MRTRKQVFYSSNFKEKREIKKSILALVLFSIVVFTIMSIATMIEYS